MNKNQLKTGMVFTLRNGKHYLLLRDMPTVRNNQIMMQGTDIAVSLNGNDGQINLNDYNYHLYYYGDVREMDIVEVSIPQYPSEIFSLNGMVLVELWKREEAK